MGSTSTYPRLCTTLLYTLTIIFIIVLVVASFNPGCTNVDTMDMWGQAHAHIYHDWHSVALTIIMSYLIRIYDGFQPVIVLQTLLFIAGILLTIRSHSTPLVGIVLLLAIVLIPPIFFWLGFVGVDSFMACSLIFAIGSLYRYKESGSQVFLWLGIIGLYLGVATRHNGIFAVLPLLAWALLRRPWFRSTLTIIVILASFVGLMKVTNIVFHVRHEYPEQGGFLYDLASLSTTSGNMLVPPEFQRPGVTLPMIQKVLDPYNDGWLFFGPDSVFVFTENPAYIKDLERTWLVTTAMHPKDYLAWRNKVFLSYAGLTATELEPIIESCIVPNALGLAPVESRLHSWIMEHLKPMGQSMFFRPYFYLTILIIFFIQGMWVRRWDTAWIALAGLAYGFGYYIFGQSANFRLACFSNFAAVLLIVRLLAERISQARAKSGRQIEIKLRWYVLASGLMLLALLETVHLSRPREAVLADEASLSNTDFESGNLVPWKPYQNVHARVSSENRHSGKFGLAEGDDSGSVYEDVTGLKPGRRYRVVAWVSASPGTTAPAQIAAWDPVANVARYSGAMVPNPNWQTIELGATASASGTLRIHLFRQPGSGTLYWDDVHIYEEE